MFHTRSSTERRICYSGKLKHITLGDVNDQFDPDCKAGKCLPHIVNVVAEKVIVHSFYNDKTFENNIALLRLETSVAYSGECMKLKENLSFLLSCIVS